jgi:small subunit ribosomal protein S9
MEVINALGRRKAAIARVYLTAGTGVITINGRTLDNYFPSKLLQFVVKQPFAVTETEGKYDLKVNLNGGGIKGQAEALRLGVARAICKIDAETFRPKLKTNGFLTRDPRKVERKKPGRPGARKRFQFSKR